MFFVLSKTLDVVLDPWWWGVVPMLVGLVLSWRGRRRAGVLLGAIGPLVLTVVSLPPVSNRLWSTLEDDAVETMRRDVVYDVVVLLGGTVSGAGATAETVAWNDNIERLLVTFELLRSGRAANVIVSGGALLDGLPTEADYLARQLEAWGIDRARIVVEPRARNTYENALFSKRLIEERGFKRIVATTSAFHVARAQGCFRAVELDVDWLPADYRMRDPARDGHWLPRAGYLEQSADALRERIGRLVYRATGKSR